MGVALFDFVVAVIVTAWTRASTSHGLGPVEQWLQATSQDEVWRVVWTQTMVGLTLAQVEEFKEVQERARKTITIQEARLQPPSGERIYRLI